MPKHKPVESRTVARVREALYEKMKTETLSEIAKAARVPYGWLQQFSYDNIVDPGFSRIERLANYLGVSLQG